MYKTTLKKGLKKSPNGLFSIFGLWGGNPVKISRDLVKKVLG
jgi:hypothetical protein